MQIPPPAAAKLRHGARLRSAHFSTRIEGNRLTLEEAAVVIDRVEQPSSKSKKLFHGRERDVREVENYWNALIRVEDWSAQRQPLTEDLIKRLHAMVEKGKRARPTPYRVGQNAVRDSDSGAIVYLPPEAKDVSPMMAALVKWVKQAESDQLPAPIIAGLVHYQFVTIHPYYDGNGRTARLLATFVLGRLGYDLNGFFSLEEHHARDLERYYYELATHPHHNYYEGRAETDLTGWIEYFVTLLAEVFGEAERHATRAASEPVAVEPSQLRRLGRRERIILGLFTNAETIRAPDIARTLALSDRMARVLAQEWVEAGWLAIADPSNRARSYKLSARYRQYIERLSAMNSVRES